VQCRHMRHQCSPFQLSAALRTPAGGTPPSLGLPTAQDLSTHRNECDGVRVFQTSVTYHDKLETTCQLGHWCGMGVVSGNSQQCECAPLALKPDDASVPLGAHETGLDLGWSAHSDVRTAGGGFAPAGTAAVRHRDDTVAYLGTKGHESLQELSSAEKLQNTLGERPDESFLPH